MTLISTLLTPMILRWLTSPNKHWIGWRVRWLDFDEPGFRKRVVRGNGKSDRDPETVEERAIVRCGKRRH